MIDAAVVDASVAVKWVLEEPGSDRARLLSSARLEAPDLLPIECANVLWKKVQLGDLRGDGAALRLALLLHAPITLADSRNLLEAAFRLSLELKHPVYDCLYLALAAKRDVPLVTADRKLVAALRKRRKPAPQVQSLDDLSLL